MDYRFTVNQAEFNHVHSHLVRCSNMFFPPLGLTVNIEEYSKKIVSNSSRFEAWNNYELVGLLAAYMNNKKEGLVFITNVSVDSEHGNRGIAGQLLKDCIEEAKRQGFGKITLEVSKENNVAIKLYKNFGFDNAEGTHSDSDKLSLQLQLK
jgi:ribosomal protein S18 acetylase RimI-like enzyme